VAHIIGIADILLKGVLKVPPGYWSSKNISDEVLDTNEKEKTYLRDVTKPVGNACHDDGTLKDADEMVWPDSLTKLEVPQKDICEWYDYECSSESESMRWSLPTAKVRYTITLTL
jgi:hypothetical protein